MRLSLQQVGCITTVRSLHPAMQPRWPPIVLKKEVWLCGHISPCRSATAFWTLLWPPRAEPLRLLFKGSVMPLALWLRLCLANVLHCSTVSLPGACKTGATACSWPLLQIRKAATRALKLQLSHECLEQPELQQSGGAW